ncbi:bifunctional diaminohydroxyphosphoribosylaminopyrimidine deaminase/5-amino-6-(5-phosphoribosylamino)uracil reductase RibD [Labilibaculum euxinus]|uniref:bifunctional diaminohydroxyphosphoribosylaminopyrimidine deaminase/5-amino-6-(5-phosphoribosylamino)uracil reductase RibD n=1 Tax=Labilibaculum euxinus TaxID=2686357 RepID=UPI001CDB49CA|nr:bifunctional diaminohydroxyphosphoribosylaminopyrimidine deaminase/5-amino-6-(5-phosphoribosylamino)uracil reductase RibD [Labilibaculum euxinus]MDQ1772318.1 bifunctional diaminohydroxyphosphoribosylaminopyrimidine deaminase/5-amino-6-(5-phosphoribosylamino)uracil reductase RibD [Labilibaculum euxinus]
MAIPIIDALNSLMNYSGLFVFMQMSKEYQYMQRAFELAKKGIGRVNPNPLVGAVIVRDNQIIGEGYHEFFGGPHAEVNAFRSATESVEGATMYVTLEPCSHYGKTPPCAEAIVKNKIGKVVIGMLDPNPLVAGKGVKLLEDNGIEVEYGYLCEELSQMNRVFLKFIQNKIPYVVMKTAMTLDGKIASETGDSRWVSNEKSRARVHQLRNELAGIMIGVDTVIADDPMLTTRLGKGEGRNPVRIVVDSSARIPLESKILNTGVQAKTIVAVTDKVDSVKIAQIEDLGNSVIIAKSKNGRVDLADLMVKLGSEGIDGILLEGGATLNFSALEAGIVDEVMSFIAPKIIGGANSKSPVGGEGIKFMKDAIELENIIIGQLGNDLMLTGKIKKV